MASGSWETKQPWHFWYQTFGAQRSGVPERYNRTIHGYRDFRILARQTY
jgi:hypothetical protein